MGPPRPGPRILPGCDRAAGPGRARN